MECPICKTALSMAERHGIEIDYCPTCRGIWLDRGELDKIIERASREMSSETAAPRAEWSGAPPVQNLPPQPVTPPTPQYAPPPAPPQYVQPRPRHDDDHHRHQQHAQHGYDPRRKKKKNFLEDLFDFD